MPECHGRLDTGRSEGGPTPARSDRGSRRGAAHEPRKVTRHPPPVLKVSTAQGREGGKGKAEGLEPKCEIA